MQTRVVHLPQILQDGLRTVVARDLHVEEFCLAIGCEQVRHGHISDTETQILQLGRPEYRDAKQWNGRMQAVPDLA